MKLDALLSVADFERRARHRLPKAIFGFVAGGSEDGLTLVENRKAFERLLLVPRGLTGVAGRTQQVALWGKTYASPIGISPMGVTAICRRDCDLLLARAAASRNIPFILSGASSVPMERLQAETADVWYQGYFPGDKQRLDRIVRRLEGAGISTLVVTSDTPVASNRENNQRNGFTIPFRPSLRLFLDGLAHPTWSLDVFARTLLTRGIPRFANLYEEIGPPITEEPAHGFRGGRDLLDWNHMSWLRDRWKGRLVVKGIVHPADAQEASRRGMDAIMVSNHGGRQLDGAISALDALAGVKAVLPPDFPVLIDSGFRRGTDVLKALALGATMVFMGRPMLYGAAVAGQAGVERVLDILHDEIDRDLALLGCRRLDDLDESFLARP